MEPIKAGIQKTQGNIFTRIAQAAWGLIKEMGHEFVEHAPEIARKIADGYVASNASRGRIVTSFNDDFDFKMGEALRITNPYKPKQTNLPEYRQSDIGRGALDRLGKINNSQRHDDNRGSSFQNPENNIARGIAGGYPNVFNAGAGNESYNPMTGSTYRQSGGSFQDFSNPTADGHGPVQEDTDFIRRNLAHAKQPVDSWEARRRHNEQMAAQQAEEQRLREREKKRQAWEKKKRDDAQATQKYIQKMRANEPPRPVHTPFSNLLSSLEGARANASVIQKLRDGKMLSDQELYNGFYHLNTKLAAARNVLETTFAEQILKAYKDRVVEIMVGPNALKNKDGYIIIGEHAYGNQEPVEKLKYVAQQELNYFKQHGQYQIPVYPSTPHLKRNLYPDVTALVKQELAEAKAEAEQIPPWKSRYYLVTTYNNNDKRDMQVGHNLPGQVRGFNAEGRIAFNNNGDVITKDQYAIFNGKIVRAGYISNYVFGYAAAAAGLSKEETKGGAYWAAAGGNLLKGQLKGDNPLDQQAMDDGWETHHQNK